MTPWEQIIKRSIHNNIPDGDACVVVVGDERREEREKEEDGEKERNGRTKMPPAQGKERSRKEPCGVVVLACVVYLTWTCFHFRVFF